MSRPNRRLAALALGVFLLLDGSAGIRGATDAATSGPDAHDRALAARLSATAAAFKTLGAASEGSTALQRSLSACPLLKDSTQDALGALVALVPILLIRLVDADGAELTRVHATLAAMHPDSPLFAEWLGLETNELGLILRLDNHGQAIDVCRAVSILIEPHASASAVKQALGVDPAVVTTILSSNDGTRLAALAARMRAFLEAAGVSRASAVALTSA